MNEINATLAKIQKELKAPKNQRNTFGNYNYRNCEDILEAVKPLLGNCTLIISDEIVNLGDRYYVKATCRFSDGEGVIENTAYARESAEKKGMDSSQITGAASSYARKYALNGLFAIDDTKDADHDTIAPKTVAPTTAPSTAHTENGNIPEHDINDDEPPPPDDGEPLDDSKCRTCGQPATRKEGEKNGKHWVGYFCTSGSRSHTRWA